MQLVTVSCRACSQPESLYTRCQGIFWQHWAVENEITVQRNRIDSEISQTPARGRDPLTKGVERARGFPKWRGRGGFFAVLHQGQDVGLHCAMATVPPHCHFFFRPNGLFFQMRHKGLVGSFISNACSRTNTNRRGAISHPHNLPTHRDGLVGRLNLHILHTPMCNWNVTGTS